MWHVGGPRQWQGFTAIGDLGILQWASVTRNQYFHPYCSEDKPALEVKLLSSCVCHLSVCCDEIPGHGGKGLVWFKVSMCSSLLAAFYQSNQCWYSACFFLLVSLQFWTLELS